MADRPSPPASVPAPPPATARRPRVLVVTVRHHPEDARIRHRQIGALLDAGWHVTYAAAYADYGVTPREEEGLTAVDIPASRGRRRHRALPAVRALLRRQGPEHDLVLVHEIELVVATRGLDLPPVVWDVQEDAAAALHAKPWLPRLLAGRAAGRVRARERAAERRVHLLLAEEGYRDRFHGRHPVVPNTTTVPATVPPPDGPRVVHVGHLTRARGVHELVAVGGLLHARTGGRLRVQLIGSADAEATALLRTDPPGVEWLGFRPYDEAMGLLDGALAGLSLLRDEPAYRVSRPTKVAEYLAHGLPVVTTELREPARLITRIGAGVVVPFRRRRADPEAVAAAVLALDANRWRRVAMADRGRAYARTHLDWGRHADEFVAHLASLAAASATD